MADVPSAEIDDVSICRQGDVIELPWIPTVNGDDVGRFECSYGVVIISQTCDIVQESKSQVTVAPLVETDAAGISSAQKGRAPLRMVLPHLGTETQEVPVVVALDKIVAVPKTALLGRRRIATIDGADSSREARAIAAGIGRVFMRFPFPDEVVPYFRKLQNKVRNTAGREGAFGRSLEYVDELRVEADQWNQPGRRLILHIVIEGSLLIPAEDADEEWAWHSATVINRKPNENIEHMSLTRVSELVVANCDALRAGDPHADQTTVLRLWERWAELVQHDLLASRLGEDNEVTEFTAELVSDEEFTHARRKRTESLDLEVLSDPRVARGAGGAGAVGGRGVAGPARGEPAGSTCGTRGRHQ